jgi:hypothetical protein
MYQLIRQQTTAGPILELRYREYPAPGKVLGTMPDRPEWRDGDRVMLQVEGWAGDGAPQRGIVGAILIDLGAHAV